MPLSPLSETLHRLVHAYKKQLHCDVSAQQITLPVTHIRALKGICRNPECTAQSIALRMQRDKAQITRVLNELQQIGLITKIDNPSDRRSQLLQPTVEGKKLMTQLSAAERKTVAHMTQGLSPAEVDTFIKLANKMSNSVDEPFIPHSAANCATQDMPFNEQNSSSEKALMGENHNE